MADPDPGSLFVPQVVQGARAAAPAGAFTERRRESTPPHPAPCPRQQPTAGHRNVVAHGDGDRSNNSAHNLRWATPSENILDIDERKPQRTGKPLEVRHVDWPETTPWRWYESKRVAETDIGMQGLVYVLNGRSATVAGVWLARRWYWETQDDLPGEEWRKYNDRLWVSNRARAQRRDNTGIGWGDRFTPQLGTYGAYATILGSRYFHIIVWETFNGRKKAPGMEVDHKNGDIADNSLANLQLLTPSQNCKKRKRPLVVESTRMIMIKGRPVDDASAPWERFVGMAAAARVLTKRLNKQFLASDISAVCKAKRKSTHGYVFEYANK